MPTRLTCRLFLALAMAAIALLALWPVFGAGFTVFDDETMIVTNADLLPQHWPAIVRYWTEPHLQLYVPLTYTAYFVLACASVWTSGALQPVWFHATSVVFHLIAGLLAWRLLTRLTGDARAAGVGAILFVLHPIQAEAVAWAASLNTVLAGMLAIGALLTATRAGQSTGGLRGQRAWFAVSCALFVLGMLAKPSIVALPLVLAAIDRLLLRLPSRQTLWRSATWALLAAPIMAIGMAAQPVSSLPVVMPLKRVGVALFSLGFYASKIVYPLHLGIDYGKRPELLTADASTLALGAVGAMMAAATWLCVRRYPLVTVAGVLFIAGLFNFMRHHSNP